MFISNKLGSFFSLVGFQTGEPRGLNESGGRPECLAWEEAASEGTLLQLLALSPPSAPHNLWICFNPWWTQPERTFQTPDTSSPRPSTSTDHWLFPAISRPPYMDRSLTLTYSNKCCALIMRMRGAASSLSTHVFFSPSDHYRYWKSEFICRPKLLLR